MEAVGNVLIFLLAVVASTFLVRLLPIKLPLPLLQIALGACLAWLGLGVRLEPHLFLLVFIPPLLFLDGWRIPKGAFFRDWKPILALAIGLVVFTVIGMGYFIHWLVPAVPLAVAFALAAILSPTDPVAVSAMTAATPLPSRLMHILEGESLLNDATGLVCFSFAVAAALTGEFSVGSASVSFLAVAGGGVLVGIAVIWIIGMLNRGLVRYAGEEPASQVLISLLIPFAAYMAAEHLHVSGILAAAVAGIAMHYNELSGPALAITRMQRTAVWDTVQVALNGVIFVLLGEQLPAMLASLPRVAAEVGAGSGWHLLGYMALITLGLGALRFFWVWIAIMATVFRAAWRGETRTAPATRLLAVTAAAGVRGAITLAGVLTLPLLMPDGSPFPARDAAISIAMGVILFSLLIASVGMPLLTRGLTADLPRKARTGGEIHARIASAEAAIRRIEALSEQPTGSKDETSVRAEAAAHLLDVYRRRLQYGDLSGEDATDMQRLLDAERRLRREALKAERDELYDLRRSNTIDDTVFRHLVHEIDLMESSLSRGGKH
ncbi:MAG: Na+/H+ antiporter [Betaproteobacteria bacterium]|nr:Na+/H+ antiporter [Betaproteobacteria bacterium]